MDKLDNENQKMDKLDNENQKMNKLDKLAGISFASFYFR